MKARKEGGREGQKEENKKQAFIEHPL